MIQQELDKMSCLDYQILARTDRSGEVMVIVYWNKDPMNSEKNRVLQSINLELQKFGMVSHSHWSHI